MVLLVLETVLGVWEFSLWHKESCKVVKFGALISTKLWFYCYSKLYCLLENFLRFFQKCGFVHGRDKTEVFFVLFTIYTYSFIFNFDDIILIILSKNS